MKDERILYEKAKKGETDFPNDNKLIKNKITKDSGINSDKVIVKSFITSQKIKEVEDSNGDITTTYYITMFNDVSFDSINEPGTTIKKSNINNTATILATNTKSASETDPTISARETITMYYNKTTSGSTTYIHVEKYEGVWAKLDSQVSISGTGILAGCNGPRLSGGWAYNANDKVIGVPVSGTKYYNTTPNAWGYVGVSADLGNYQLGKVYMTLKRLSTGSTWTHDVEVGEGVMKSPI